MVILVAAIAATSVGFDPVSAMIRDLLGPLQSIAEKTDPTLSRAVRVIDGDTLAIGSERIRLLGIDAPELAQTCRRSDGTDWGCGQAAAAALSAEIGGRSIQCERKDRDHYGRTIAICRVGDTDLNAQLVRDGLAVAHKDYSKRYVPQEIAARLAKRGIWATEFLSPREWRTK